LFADTKVDNIDSSENAVAINVTAAQAIEATYMAKLQSTDTVVVASVNLGNLDFVAGFMGGDIAKVDHFTVTDAAFLAGGSVGNAGGDGVINAVGEWLATYNAVGNDVFSYWDGAGIAVVNVVGVTSFTAVGTDLAIVI
jgi:hypothetical protein